MRGERPTRLGIIVLAVDELPRSLAFYRAAFGWPTEVETPVYAEFRLTPDLRLGLYQRAAFARNVGVLPQAIPAGTLSPTELYLFSDDLTTTSNRLLAAGGRLLSPSTLRDWGDEVAYFADLDGNILALARAAAASA